MLGFYLLFTPLVKFLTFIPLFGWLLSTVAAIALMIFSIVVGGTISLFVIGIAWLFYRPLFGATLLVFVGVSVYFMLFYFKLPESEDTI